ncbi:hypothetical protein [Streptomyces sp. NPDC014006]|uniref:hypothetical protein n=1 Tax=Streptomyces sp. NPDC014006 TaxID=3364870 RepID=UPI0037021816
MGLVCVPLALLGAPTGRRQRELLRRLLGADLTAGSRTGLAHALPSTPLNLLAAAVTFYGFSLVPMNLLWPLRAGDDYASAWAGPPSPGRGPSTRSSAGSASGC